MWSERREARSSGRDKRDAGARARASIVLAIALWILADVALAACPICFQAEDTGTTAGVRAAVIVLGGVTAVVLGGAGLFVRRLVKAESR